MPRVQPRRILLRSKSKCRASQRLPTHAHTTRADAPCAVLQLKCNAEGTDLTAGLKCSDIGGPAGCGGMLAGTAGSGHNRYLCNRITLAVRHYMARYYNSPYQCEECGAETKVRIRPSKPATPGAHICAVPAAAVGRVGGLALRRVRPGGDAMRDARVPGLHGQTGARPHSAAPARVVPDWPPDAVLVARPVHAALLLPVPVRSRPPARESAAQACAAAPPPPPPPLPRPLTPRPRCTDKETLPRLSHNEMDAMDTVLAEVERFLVRARLVLLVRRRSG